MLSMQSASESFFDQSLSTVRSIVLHHVSQDFSVFLFGSSASGNRSHSSDIDIGFLGQTALPQNTLRCIREEIEESYVPFGVDLVDFFNKPDSFKTIALQTIQLWQSAPKKF